jgi:hypothetical protein
MLYQIEDYRKETYEAIERIYASRHRGDTRPVSRREIRAVTGFTNAQMDTILPWLKEMDLITLISRGTGWLPNGLPPLFCWLHGYKVNVLGRCSACERKERDVRMKALVEERRKAYEETQRQKRLRTEGPEFSI